MAQDALKLFGKCQIPALEFCQLHQELDPEYRRAI